MKNKFKLSINTNCGESKNSVKTPDIIRRSDKTNFSNVTKHRISVIKISMNNRKQLR